MWESDWEIVELVCLVAVSVMTLVGNCLVILAFAFGPRSIRTFTNYFVVNLAISDLMVGCLSMPFWMIYRAGKPIAGDRKIYYKFFITLDILCGTSSILSLAAISMERMFAVRFPTRHYNLNSKPVFISIIGTWLCGAIFAGAKFSTKSITSIKIFSASIFTLVFLIPLFVIVISYLMIYFAAAKMLNETRQPGRLHRELKVAKMISVIIALFIFFWMPFFTVNMLYRFCEPSFCIVLKRNKWVIHLSKLMHYCNSMMNYFVYAARCPEFRRTFKAILFKCNTSSLRDRVRIISESIVIRGRSFSERTSFIQENNNSPSNGVVTNISNNRKYDESPQLKQHSRLLQNRTSYKSSRLSYNSNCTEISILEDGASVSNTSSCHSNSSTTYLLQSVHTNKSILNSSNHFIEKESDSTSSDNSR